MLVNDAPIAAAEAASEGLWSLASSCTGSAIIALGPNTKIESWPGFQVTRVTLTRRLRSLCNTDSAFYIAKVWLTIHTATLWHRDRETIGKPDVFPEPSASGLTPFIRDLEPKMCRSRSDCQRMSHSVVNGNRQGCVPKMARRFGACRVPGMKQGMRSNTAKITIGYLSIVR
jgi:hypothetical protein